MSGLHIPHQSWWAAARRSQGVGYAAAIVVPTTLTFATTWLALPPFVFEHLVVLLVVVVALPWGLGPAVATAIVSVAADNVLLTEPVGRPTISGYRDFVDLLLFATVAVVVSGLVTRAHADRVAAQEAADRERRAREERDRLIETISHDLATPLSVLSGTVQFARAREATQVDWARLLDRLETASVRATSLLRMLSDARALDEDDGVGLTLTTCDLRSLVSPITRMMDRFSETHPVLLSAPEQPVTIVADPARLQRVVENLVNNAIKYSPHGGAIEVSVAIEGRHAVLRVRDDGIGISADDLPRIFDKSFRAVEAARHAPGLGLGLSIAAQVVSKHGGTITAESAEGAGSVFVVRLPLVNGVGDVIEPRSARQGAMSPGL